MLIILTIIIKLKIFYIVGIFDSFITQYNKNIGENVPDNNNVRRWTANKTKMGWKKMVIPSNQIEAFSEAIEENKLFLKFLKELNKEFGEYLTNKLSVKTAQKNGYAELLSVYYKILLQNIATKDIPKVFEPFVDKG